jgi:hypothetical protein
MVIARRFGAWLALLSGSLAATQGCIVDGDASLGSDGEAAASGSAGKSASGGSSTAGSGGKPNPGGSSTSSGSTAGGKTGAGGTAPSEAGAANAAGESTSGGAPSGEGICALPIEVGDCDAAISSFAFDTTSGACKPFTYGGCGGNANRFSTQADCQAACENLECPSYLQTDEVYEVLPLNRPEQACVDFARRIVVSCSMLLNPSETVPTDYGTQFCVKRDGQLYRAGTTLPKANGWEDCSAPEAELVAEAPSCEDL